MRVLLFSVLIHLAFGLPILQDSNSLELNLQSRGASDAMLALESTGNQPKANAPTQAPSPPKAASPPQAGVPNKGFNSVMQGLFHGFQYTIGAVGDTLAEYVRLLRNPSTNFWSDTAFSAMKGASKELAVAAVTVRKAIDPTDWDAVHAIGGFLTPLMTLATSEAGDIVSKYTNFKSTNPQVSHADLVTRIETYASTLRSIATVGQSFDLDTSALLAAIKKVEAVVKDIAI